MKLSDKLDDEFHIEPSSDHFKTKKEYHSVIYKASDLHYPHSYGKDLDLSEKTRKWIEESRRLPKENFDESERMVPRVPHRYRRSTEDKVICQIHLRVSYEFCCIYISGFYIIKFFKPLSGSNGPMINKIV